MTMLNHDPNNDWAQVELYRRQYGELPGEGGKEEKPLDEPLAMERMAEALLSKNPKKMPSPFNVSSVLKYAASLIRKSTPSPA